MQIKDRSVKELVKNCFLVNTAASVVAASINVAVTGLNAIFLFEYFVFAFVYANFIGTLISFVIFYISPSWQDDLTLVRLVKLFVSMLAATVAGILLARLILAMVFVRISKDGVIPSWENFVLALGISLIVGFGVYFYEVSQTELRRKQYEAENAKSLATNAQLASLESRVHPHFLFNTLNSIAALIKEDPVIAEGMVERLSSLLRYSLDSDSQRLVSLIQEIDITRKYLEIEKVRFGERLNYDIEVVGDVSRVNLPQLSLQTLVENTIKHVVAARPGLTEIHVAASIEDNEATIQVKDNGPGFRRELICEGHGLDLLQKRLDVIFGRTAQINIGHAIVELKIPLQPKFESITAKPATIEPRAGAAV